MKNICRIPLVLLWLSLLGTIANAQPIPEVVEIKKVGTSLLSEPYGNRVLQRLPSGTVGKVLEAQHGYYLGNADNWYKIQVEEPSSNTLYEGWVHGSETRQANASSRFNADFKSAWEEFMEYLLEGAIKQADGFIHPELGLRYVQLDPELNPQTLELESFSQICGYNFTGKEVVHNRIFATVHNSLINFHKLLRFDKLNRDNLCCFKRKGCFNDLRFGNFPGLSFVAQQELEQKYGATDLVNPSDEVYHSPEYLKFCEAIGVENKITHRVLISVEDPSGCNWVVSCFLYRENEKWFVLAIDSHQCIKVAVDQ